MYYILVKCSVTKNIIVVVGIKCKCIMSVAENITLIGKKAQIKQMKNIFGKCFDIECYQVSKCGRLN